MCRGNDIKRNIEGVRINVGRKENGTVQEIAFSVSQVQ